jgi:NTP pyrophosphatase (non-canonical NTP hydrolase)
MVSDGGEVLDAMKDYFWYEKNGFDDFVLSMAEELGDTLHWLQAVANVMGFTLTDLMEVNKAKLSVRYPDGFTKAAASIRDKAAEREAMKDALYQEK